MTMNRKQDIQGLNVYEFSFCQYADELLYKELGDFTAYVLAASREDAIAYLYKRFQNIQIRVYGADFPIDAITPQAARAMRNGVLKLCKQLDEEEYAIANGKKGEVSGAKDFLNKTVYLN